MRYSLRTLLIIMLLAGPLGAFGWRMCEAYRTAKEDRRSREIAYEERQRIAVMMQLGLIREGPIRKEKPPID